MFSKSYATRKLKYSELRPRNAGRALVLDPENRTLIFEYEHLAKNNNGKSDALVGKGSYFVTPGGKKEENESFYECTARELREETGIADRLDPTVIAKRWAPLLMPSGEVVCATEQYFCVKVAKVPEIDRKEWSSQEQKTIQKIHWFTLAEIEDKVGQNLWPVNLPEIVRAVVEGSELPVLYKSKGERIGDTVLEMDE